MHLSHFAFLVQFFLSLTLLENIFAVDIAFLILAERSSQSKAKWKSLKDEILHNAKSFGFENVRVFVSCKDFEQTIGGWAVWPLIDQLTSAVGRTDWLFICEDSTVINMQILVQWLAEHEFLKYEKAYFGHALFDTSPTIVHHYAFAGEDPKKFLYPDFAGGVIFTWPTVRWLNMQIRNGKGDRGFTIDPKHELAMLLWDNGNGITLTPDSQFCTVAQTDVWPSCASYFDANNGNCRRTVDSNDVLFGVKTYHKHHKTRIVVLKRTWGKDALNIEFYSDSDDYYIPTINLGVENTERGHCGKTEAIFKRFYRKMKDKFKKIKWLVIVDDDTLLNVKRLRNLLQCYDPEEKLILGEKYGYGFGADRQNGYDYPTGGSGPSFPSSKSFRQTVEMLAKDCKCPSIDSPDDMILGMCARSLGIPVLHSAALHQARPEDYAEDYLKRLKPVSFHRHWEVDPYKVYTDWLKDDERTAEKEKNLYIHSEL